MGRKKTLKGSTNDVPSEGKTALDRDSEIVWSPNPERAGTTFNLSRQVSKELDRLRVDLMDQNVRSSKSEMAEVALQIAIEEVRRRGAKSELLRRLSGNYRRL